MRESNYRSIANNRAAVTITTSLYDRRALDVTSDKPLVNSLNHLTYLVSSSAKVRETLSNDGGIERLVAILHECQSRKFASLDALRISEQKLLTAWKWTLAFQCIVLIGTRGTEKIRQKVVCAGMLPVIATIFDNYQCLRDNAFAAGQAMAGSDVCPYMQQQYLDQSIAPGATRGHTHATHPGSNDSNGLYSTPPPTDADQQDSVRGFLNPLAEGDTQAGTFMNIRLPENHPPMNGGTIPMNMTGITRADPETNIPFILQSTANTIASLSSAPSLYLMGGAGRSEADFMSDRPIEIESLTSEDYDGLTIPHLLKLVKSDASLSSTVRDNSVVNGIANSVRKRYLTVMLLSKLREIKEKELAMSYLSEDGQIEMDTNLNFLTDLFLQDERSIHTSNAINTKIAPRNFTDSGIIIPRDDDVVWCLQLLAYVSKYPYLKDILQNTHLIPNMSIREKQLRMLTMEKMRQSRQRPIVARETLIPRSRKGRFLAPSTLPAVHVGDSRDVASYMDGCDPSLDLLGDDLNIRNETFGLAGNTIEQYEKVTSVPSNDPHESDDDFDDYDEDSDHKTKDDDEEVDEYLLQFEDNVTLSAQNSSYLASTYDSIIDAESIGDDMDRKLTLYHLNLKISRLVHAESHKLSNTIIEKRMEQRRNYSHVWEYNTYKYFDIDEDTNDGCSDVDESLLQYKKVNLFPMVEQFTFFGGTDMYYWSGVIMRNSCRRNDFKGGVRQCGNLECGKWEKYPREFSKCKRCKRTKYCSRECQTRAWTCHKNWCVPSNSSNSTATNDSVPARADNAERAGNVAAAGSDAEAVAYSASDSQLGRPSDDSQPMDM